MTNTEKEILPLKEVFFQERHVVITGGASGIGRALAEQFQKLGAHVTIIDKSVSNELPEQISAITADVTDAEQFEKAISFESIDVLVIAAGVTSETNDPTEAEQSLMDAVNVRGVENTLKIFESFLVPNAQVVYIGTDNPPKDYYAKTKRSGAQLVRDFSLRNQTVSIRIILLGPVRTPLFEKGKSPKLIKKIEEKVPIYEPDEFADELIDKLLVPLPQDGLEEVKMYKKVE